MTRSKSLPVVVGVIRCGLKGGNEIALSRCAETRVERILKGPDCECSALRAHKKRVEVVALAHQLMANAREGTTMASHANAAKLCKSCSKPSPKGAWTASRRR